MIIDKIKLHQLESIIDCDVAIIHVVIESNPDDIIFIGNFFDMREHFNKNEKMIDYDYATVTRIDAIFANKFKVVIDPQDLD